MFGDNEGGGDGSDTSGDSGGGDGGDTSGGDGGDTTGGDGATSDGGAPTDTGGNVSGETGSSGVATDAGAADGGINAGVLSDEIATSTSARDQLTVLLDQLRQSLANDQNAGVDLSDQTLNLARQTVDAAVAAGAPPVDSAEDYQARIDNALRVAGATKQVVVLADVGGRAQAAASDDLIFVDLQDSPPQQNVQTGGDPIELFSGQFVFENDDVIVQGAGVDFVFHRTYKNRVVYDGPLGNNWDHSHNLWIGELGGTILLCSNGALREDTYTRHPKFGQAGYNYWVPPDGQHDVVVENGDSYARVTPSGRRYLFEPKPSIPGYHRLQRIEDRFGNYLAFTYTDDRLAHVEINTPVRGVTFGYDGDDRIISITDHTSRVWSYDYDDLGDLVAFTLPATDRYPAGSTTQYEYSTSRYSGVLAHNLLRITDPAGRLYLENEYGSGPSADGFNRVVRQRIGTGEIQIEYESVIEEFDTDYTDVEKPAVQVNFMDRGGQPIHFVYNKFGNLLLREELVTTALGIDLAQWRYRYNADGAIIDALPPEGRLQQVYYGRDDFQRANGLAVGDVATADALTMQARLAFGNVLSAVQRGRLFNLASLDTTSGIWGDLYPDLFAVQPEDVIQKWTYEPDYQQMLSSSDPRFTLGADPNGIEGPDYSRTLTHYAYTGPAGDTHQLLAAISNPSITQADGTQLPGGKESYDDYDANGRLLQRTDSAGVVTRYEYFDASAGATEGFLRSVIRDPLNLALTTSYDRDNLGRMTAVSSPRAQGAPAGQFTTRIELNALDQITQVTRSAPFNYAIHRFYEPGGMVERVERDAKDEAGVDVPGAPEVRTFAYDDELNLVRESAGGVDLSKHLVTRHAYDAAGRRAATVLPAGNKLLFGYDGRGLSTAMTRGAGTPDASTTRRQYDLDGLLTAAVSARGFYTHYTRDVFGRIVDCQDALGHVSRYDYDKAGNPIVVRVFERQSDGTYNLVSRSEAQYDELNRVTQQSANLFDTPIPATNLDTDGLASPGPGRLLTTRIFYEPRGRIVRIVDPMSHEVRLEYGVPEQPTAVVNAAGDRLERRYDANENMIRRDVRSPIFDPATGLQTGEAVFTQTYAFDALDRLQSATDALGNTTTYTYDSRDNFALRTDPLGNARRTEYDLLGRPWRYTQSLTDSGLGAGNVLSTASTQVSYDLNGNPTGVTDALQNLTQQEFDALDRLRTVTYPDLSQIILEYDPDSNLQATTDANLVRRSYTCDPVGQALRMDVDASAAVDPIEGASFERYEYSALRLQRVAESDFARCEIARNSLGWPTTETTTITAEDAPFGSPLVVQRGFDDRGAPTTLTYPGGRQIGFNRDALGRIAEIDNVSIGSNYPGGAVASPLASFKYIGAVKSSVTFGNGAGALYAYDRGRRLIELSHAGAGAALSSFQQLFDDASNVRFRDTRRPTGSSGYAFAYDSSYRLTFAMPRTNPVAFAANTLSPATTPPPDPLPNSQLTIGGIIGSLSQPSATPTWQYDLNGNRLTDRQGAVPISYSPNPLDEYMQVAAASWRYDRSGNLRSDGARAYFYDSANHLVRITDATGVDLARYHHDAWGRRITEIATGTTSHFAYDGANAVSEYAGGNLLAQIVYGDGVDTPVHLATGGQAYWYHLDPGGSVVGLTDSSGALAGSYSYTPFGATLQSSGPHNRLQFAGRPLDEATSTYDFRARHYDPAAGRFLQRDPRGMRDGTNQYAYAGNDPVGFVDPSGMSRLGASTARPQPAQALPQVMPVQSSDSSIDPTTVVKALDTARKAASLLLSTDIPVLTGQIANMLSGTSAPDSVVNAVWSAQDWLSDPSSNPLLKLSPAGSGPNFTNTQGFAIFGAAVSGALAALEADKRGVGPVGVLGDMLTSVALTAFGKNLLSTSVFNSIPLGSSTLSSFLKPSFINPVDAIINVVNGVVSLISPRAGVYTKILASATPSQVIKQFAITFIDTIDAGIRGDGDRAIQIHEQRLSGKYYGSVVQGYALYFNFVAAEAFDQESQLFKLSDAAASGELGPLAQFGDWLGDQVYNVATFDIQDALRDPVEFRKRYGR